MIANQFEIYLKDDFIDYFMTSSYDKNFSPDGTRYNRAIYMTEKYGQDPGHKRGFSPCKNDKKGATLMDRFKDDQNNLVPDVLKESAMSTLDTKQGAWSNREEQWVIEERRLLFSTLNHESTNTWIEVLEALVTGNIPEGMFDYQNLLTSSTGLGSNPQTASSPDNML
jgi:hypothetical protein